MFQTDWSVDHEGGRTLTDPPGNWRNVTDILTEEQALDIQRQDGDTIRVWLRAFDVMGNIAEDNVTVHVDSSPPVLDSMLILPYMGTDAANHRLDLPSIKVMFTAFDEHSGLHGIHWELHDLTDANMVHGDGHITVKTKSVTDPDCLPPQCVCVSVDDDCYFRNYEIALDADNLPANNRSYYIIVTVTNNAMLQTKKRYTVPENITSLLSGYGDNIQVDRNPTAELAARVGIAVGIAVVGVVVVGVLATLMAKHLRGKKIAEETTIYDDVITRKSVTRQRAEGYGEYDIPMETFPPRPDSESAYQELRPAIYEHLRR